MPAFIEILGGESKGLIIGLTPKAACTSFRSSIRVAVGGMCWSVHQLRESFKPVRIYIRHPLSRFASCWAFFVDSAKFPRSIPQVPPGASLELFTDMVLDGAQNEHWHPQVDLYQGCNVQELYRFEELDVPGMWPSDIPLLHLNKTPKRKPPIRYRRAELLEYYKEDILAWQNASTYMNDIELERGNRYANG